MEQPFALILASASPRRRKLLSRMGYAFETCAPDVDEHVEGRAEDIVKTLAVRKAPEITALIREIIYMGGAVHVGVDRRARLLARFALAARAAALGAALRERAREQLAHRVLGFHLPDKDLAFFMQGEPLFDDYVEAVSWAQDYARENREAMMARVLHEMRHRLPKFQLEKMAVNCHHNYVQQETHAGVELLVTRKGAVSARAGELGIIPGSMGAKSFIVRGLGNADSFHSCSHGAGRVMSRTRARQEITLAQHREATAHVECRKDAGVIDESPAAYKDIDAVMAAQSDLVEIVHTLGGG